MFLFVCQHSQITLDSAVRNYSWKIWGTIRDHENQTWVNHMQDECPSHCIITPIPWKMFHLQSKQFKNWLNEYIHVFFFLSLILVMKLMGFCLILNLNCAQDFKPFKLVLQFKLDNKPRHGRNMKRVFKRHLNK